MLENTRSLAVFALVAETGSFRGAAKRLGISPAAVSGHVSRLEDRYGVALLYRSTRKLTLTQVGRDLATHGRGILDAELAARDLVDNYTSRPTGRLRVAAPSWLQHGAFVDDISQFSRLHPEVEIDLSFTDLEVDLIGDGLDLVLRVGPVADSALKCRHLAQVREVLVASPAYLADHPPLETPDDLAAHWFVGFPALQLNPVFVAVEPGVESYQKVAVRSRFSVETRHFAYQFALRGMGLAILPDYLALEDLRRGKLVELLPAWQLQPKEMLAIWPANAGRRSAAQVLVDFLVHNLREVAKTDEVTRARL